MTGAMYAGIAGLRTHMQDLNVIGNNIANVNTKGYKAGRSVFRSALYTQISGGREGTSVVGSKNPSQLGYGATLATVDIDMSTAGITPGNPTDVMIDGDGFFMVGDKSMANVVDPTNPNTMKTFNLTRVGDFEFGADGYLVDNMGNAVYGFLVVGTIDGKPIYSDQLVPIRVPRMTRSGDILWPSLQNVDENGNVVEEGGDAEGGTRLSLVDTLYAPQGDDAADTADQIECGVAQLTNVTIGETGVITGTVRLTGEQITVGAIALATVDNPNGVTQVNNSYYKCGQGSGDLYVNMVGGLSKDKDTYVAHTATIPGQGEGDDAEDYSLPQEFGTIDESGISRGMTYVNHSQIFATEDGGGEETNLPYGSSVFDTGSSTVLHGGYLETSKTDLATEIANMITTQRGYQANTRIITVTDSMLEELVNMKR